MKLLLSVFILSSLLCFGNDVKDRAVIIDAEYESDRITLSWLPDDNAAQYIVLRKFKTDPKFVDTLAILEGTIDSFIDENVEPGIVYEYAIWKDSEFEYDDDGETKIFEYYGFGYIFAGKDIPLIENRGHILLLIDNTLKNQIQKNLDTYKLSLIGDGWTVSEYLVPRAEEFNPNAVKTVKDIIRFEYERLKEELRTVVLIGRVPVPYSGKEAIDGHRPEHFGAWPTDVYYADIDGVWTDDTTTNTTAADNPRHYNIPYDGKFDQIRIPSETELEIGRIDMYDLSYFHNEPNNLSEADLLNRYFEKNHKYKHRIIEFEDNALIDDSWQLYSEEAWGANPWAGFSALIGNNAIDTGGIRKRLKTEKFKLIWGGNSGAYDNILHTAYANEYAESDQNAVFAFYFGSWMPDWDAENALMRSAIASNPSILVSAFYGRPPWYIHHMNIGETIGYSSKITQNNGIMYKSTAYVGRKFNHIALMGDPTVRFHPEIPPHDFQYHESSEYLIEFTWSNAGKNVLGYNLFQSGELFGEYARINDEIIENETYVYAGHSGRKYYQLRAIYDRKTVSTNYTNQSQGVFLEVDLLNSIVDESEKNNIKVYPIPANDYLNIEVPVGFANSQIKIINIFGSVVIELDDCAESTLLNVKSLKSGTYYMKISNFENDIVIPIIIMR